MNKVTLFLQHLANLSSVSFLLQKKIFADKCEKNTLFYVNNNQV